MNKDLYNFINESYFQQTETPIFEHFLNPKLNFVGQGKSEVVMEIKHQHLNLHRMIHGGVLAAFADMAMGIACLSYNKSIVTSEMHLSYIRNVTAGKLVKAIGNVDNNGNNLMRTSCSIYDEDNNLLLKAMATYFVVGELQIDNKH